MRFRRWPPCFLILYIFCFLNVSPQNSSSCAGTVIFNATKEAQYLTTPNYDNSYRYPPLLDCKFLIKAPDKSRIAVEVIDMEMEPRIFDECSDYVGFTEEVEEKNISMMTLLCENMQKAQFLSASNMLTIHFHTDEIIESRGARLKYNYYELTSCPPGWTETSEQNCVFLEADKKTDWMKAQKRCLDLQSNLVMFSTVEKAKEIEDLYKSVRTRLWVGNNDAVSEGKLVDLANKDAPHIARTGFTSSITDNNDENDCQTMQFNDDEQFRMDNCASQNGYICEMKKDGTSELYPPLIYEIQEGSSPKTSFYTILLLVFCLGLFFLVILAFLCFHLLKRKEAGRVHTENAVIQQNAFMNDSGQRAEQPRTSTGGQSAIPAANNTNRTSRSSPVTVPMENNRPPPKKFPMAPVPNRLPMSEENSTSDNVVETGILSADQDVETVSAAPQPQPRTLPPMPTREGTFHSINTREGSTMRTRRNKELFERPVMHVLDNVSAISLDEFWSNKKT